MTISSALSNAMTGLRAAGRTSKHFGQHRQCHDAGLWRKGPVFVVIADRWRQHKWYCPERGSKPAIRLPAC